MWFPYCCKLLNLSKQQALRCDDISLPQGKTFLPSCISVGTVIILILVKAVVAACSASCSNGIEHLHHNCIMKIWQTNSCVWSNQSLRVNNADSLFSLQISFSKWGLGGSVLMNVGKQTLILFRIRFYLCVYWPEGGWGEDVVEHGLLQFKVTSVCYISFDICVCMCVFRGCVGSSTRSQSSCSHSQSLWEPRSWSLYKPAVFCSSQCSLAQTGLHWFLPQLEEWHYYADWI